MDGRLLRCVRPAAEAQAVARRGDGHLKAMLRRAERRALLEAVSACDGNLGAAARRLGVARQVLAGRLQALEIELL